MKLETLKLLEKIGRVLHVIGIGKGLFNWSPFAKELRQMIDK